MNYQTVIDKIEPELEKVTSFLQRELQKIRTERASPSLVEDVKVEYFGKKYSLKELAAISIPNPREILIKPWDESYIGEIEKSLRKKKVGGQPVVAKNIIRIKLPPLSKEFREDLISLLHDKKEQAKRTIRRWRDEAWGEIQENFREGEISEDDKFKGKDKLQELIDEYNEKVTEMMERKKKEIEN